MISYFYIFVVLYYIYGCIYFTYITIYYKKKTRLISYIIEPNDNDSN